MKYEILSISIPENSSEWGIVQINNFSNTYFRFDIQGDKFVLDSSYFADQLSDDEEKHRDLSFESDLYKGIQELLETYQESL